MTDAMAERFGELIEAERVESIDDHAFVEIFTLDSELRYGLIEDLRWAVVGQQGLIVFAPGQEKHFVEVLEHQRRDIDELVEKRSAEKGFAPMDVVFSFPAIELIRAMLTSGSVHFCRVGLAWALPSELRELRADIQRASENRDLPVAVRQLAQRLVVAD